MHAAAVVAEERLGHEGGGEAVLPGDVLDHVLVDHHVVGHAGQRVEAHVDLGLAGRGHLVVMDLDRDAGAFERQHDLAAHILQRIGGRGGEIAALGRDLAAEVRAQVLAAVPPALAAVDVIEGLVGAAAVAHIAEDEELRLGPEVAGVADAGLLEIGLGAPGDEARIARSTARA